MMTCRSVEPAISPGAEPVTFACLPTSGFQNGCSVGLTVSTVPSATPAKAQPGVPGGKTLTGGVWTAAGATIGAAGVDGGVVGWTRAAGAAWPGFLNPNAPSRAGLSWTLAVAATTGVAATGAGVHSKPSAMPAATSASW